VVKHRIWSRNRYFINKNTNLIWSPGIALSEAIRFGYQKQDGTWEKIIRVFRSTKYNRHKGMGLSRLVSNYLVAEFVPSEDATSSIWNRLLRSL